MAATCKTNGSIGMRAAIFLLQFIIMAIVFFLFSELNATTQQNSATLVRHEAKLAAHDSNFEQILGHFSPEFALKLRKYMPSENR
jgi:hypothetical protein